MLFSRLYESTPTTPKRDGRAAPVGTVIFDPDGEYFWPDEKGRPGLCDVRALRDQLVHVELVGVDEIADDLAKSVQRIRVKFPWDVHAH